MRKINYPKTRDSPYRHRVRQHKRLGYVVHSYERGKGPKPSSSKKRKPAPPIRREKTSRSKKSTSFNVRVEYPDYSIETLDVVAPTFVRALDRGIEERKKLKIPVLVAMRRR